MDVGVDAAEHQRMAGGRVGHRVAVVSVSEIGAALEQALESAFAEIRPEAQKIVGAQLIDGDHHGEFWRQHLGSGGGRAG